MLHIRRILSKKEKKEYQEWLKKNKVKKISKEQQEKLNQERLRNSLNDPRRRDLPSNVSQTSFLSRMETCHPEISKAVQKYDDQEMAKREAIAQEQIALKRQRTAPLYNKGPYMFLTPDTDLTTIGKKI